jgi:hypothetical protein
MPSPMRLGCAPALVGRRAEEGAWPGRRTSGGQWPSAAAPADCAISTVLAHAAVGYRQIAELADELDGQRRTVAAWIVAGLRERGRLRPELDADRAVDILWVLLDHAVHRRLIHDRGWSVEAFTGWLVDGVVRLLPAPPTPVRGDPPRSPAVPLG